MHYNYCIKNISKCPFCGKPFPTKEMQEHIDEMKGDPSQIKALAEEGKIDVLKNMAIHGADVVGFMDAENMNNSLMHIAAKANNKELIYFLNQENANLDTQNRNGETALHMVCGKQPNEEMAKFLVMCGASTQVKNALGDTPVTLAKRCGQHDLALVLNTSENQR